MINSTSRHDKKHNVFQVMRKKLILLYMFTTGCVLTFVLVLVLLISEKQEMDSTRAAFKDNLAAISNLLVSSISISSTRLAELEATNKLIIHIEDGGVPRLFDGAWKKKECREKLVNQMKILVKQEGIDAEIRPVTTLEIKSEIYYFKAENNERYFGAAYIAAKGKGYRSLILLQSVSDMTRDLVRQRPLSPRR